jgi:hypothetical protein
MSGEMGFNSVFFLLVLVIGFVWNVCAGASLPEGWAATSDPQGRQYFYNVDTKETSWTLPGTGGAITGRVENPKKSIVRLSSSEARALPPQRTPTARSAALGDAASTLTTTGAGSGLDLKVSELKGLLVTSQQECDALCERLREADALKSDLEEKNKMLKATAHTAQGQIRAQKADIQGLLEELEVREQELMDTEARLRDEAWNAGAGGVSGSDPSAPAAAIKTVGAALSVTSASLRQVVTRLWTPAAEPPTPPYPTAKLKKLKSAVVKLKGNLTALREEVMVRDATIEDLSADRERCRQLHTRAEQAAARKLSRVTAALEALQGQAASRDGDAVALREKLADALLTLAQKVEALRVQERLVVEGESSVEKIGQMCSRMEVEVASLKREAVEREELLAALQVRLARPWYLWILNVFKFKWLKIRVSKR